MTRAALLCALALLPGAALAHPGVHLHPHGAETPVWLLLAAGAAIAILAILRRGCGRP
jgi:hypothetical protein